MQSRELRSRFLRFFEEYGHEAVASSSLLPHNDPTLFFVNAGMVQFKDVFTGAETRESRRATTVQKCLRVSGKHNDLENVGRTPRHHTFFEMLGNFSFGDYFKADAIPMAWAFLTEVCGLDPERLWVTVFEDDDEAFDLWVNGVGVPVARVQRLGAKENFWSMGETGPCGPCTEIHYDHGPEISDNTDGPAGEDPRYVEIWNLVFMQYEQAADGTRTPLPRPSIDTGMGLERIAAVMQGVYSNYDTDLFQSLIQRIAALAGVTYGANGTSDTALRVIADHARATAFLVGDGVMPSNEGRGYVLRRIMRRAIRFGVKLGLNDAFFHEATDQVIADFGDVYPELSQRMSFIQEVVRGEETRFRRTLDRGMRLLDNAMAQVTDAGGTIPGDVAFKLSDTYGFPLDLTRLIAEENGVGVDEAGFATCLEAQRTAARQAWKGSGEQAVEGLWQTLAQEKGTTEFLGYDRDEAQGEVLALVRKGTDGALEQVDALAEGDQGTVLMDQTPFYAESGGQVGDRGEADSAAGALVVTDTTKAAGLYLHHVRVARGRIAVGDALRLHVDAARRDAIRKNHTATHLLHAALREILGTHVTQKGSMVSADRLRFDFAHHKPITEAERVAIEERVYRQVLRNRALNTDLKDLDDAIAAGAMALFGEKYASQVRVVSVPDFSVELCGGTHVHRTGDIGLFRITSESGIAAGVRRIEAVTGLEALSQVRQQSDSLADLASQLKTQVGRLPEVIGRLQDERRALERRLEAIEVEQARAAAGDLVSQARDVGGVKVLIALYDGDLRAQADRLRDQLGSAVIVLVSTQGAKVRLLVAATPDIAGKRFHSGKVVGQLAALVSGRGGGRPDLAQAGGNDASSVPVLMEQAPGIVDAALG